MRYEDERLERVERELRELRARVDRLEGARAEGWRESRQEESPAPPPPPRAETPRRESRPGIPSAPTVDLEELLGGRVLAWVGGSAILLGIVFFLGMAISRGWIDEPTRTVMAFLGSTALLALGVWLYERKGRTEAALAAVATAISGLYATLIVATQVYDLIAPEVGLLVAAVVGATATAIAVRWNSTVVGAIGILGALLAPVLVDAGTSGVALLFMIVALCSAVGVLLWQRWNWLGLGAFVVSAPQLIGWIDNEYRESLALTLAVLAAYWALFVVAAIGYELRTRTPERLPYASWVLLFLNVVLTAATGYIVLNETDHQGLAIAWIVGLAAAHVLVGVFALREAINREIGSLLIAVGLGLSAIAFADALDGPVLVAGWAVQAVVLAYLASRASRERERLGSNADRLLAASSAYLGGAILHTLAFEAPLTSLRRGVDDLGEAVVALALVAAAAFASSRFAPVREWAQAVAGLGAAALVYLGSVVIVDTIGVHDDGSPRQAGQVWLSAYWTVLGLAGIVYGLLRDRQPFRLAGLALLGIAVVKVFLYDLAELEEIYRVLSFIALGLLLLAGAYAYQRIRVTVKEEQS